MINILRRSLLTVQQIASQVELTPVSIANTLNKLQGVPSELYIEEAWFLDLISYAKKQVGRIEGDPLAGIAYYSAKMDFFDAELWSLLEMQFGRTKLPSKMKNVSLVKTLEAFCLYEGESHEVAWNIQDVIVDRTKSYLKTGKPTPLNFHELSTALWSLTHLGQHIDDIAKYVPDLLQTSGPEVGDDCLKFVWSLAYNAKLKPDLMAKVKAEFEESLARTEDLGLRSQAEWANSS
mmetsp:Transcript_21985/g.40135  ORF Transcript_21985/g.40135 Transcript_21985/m.40135 type:complete len:235 (+) Transcript_21985:1320-2024(+)